MIKYLSILTIILIANVSCASTVELPEEYERCVHTGSPNKVILFERENAVRHETDNCSEFLLDEDGNCPVVIVIEDVEGTIHNLSGDEIMNYECEYINNTSNEEKEQQ